jgi:hypothetical protein
VRLTKTPEAYRQSRDDRRELTYEAMLAAGRPSWSSGERVRVYRTAAGTGALAPDAGEEGDAAADPRDYDVEHYVRLLRDTYASRLERAFHPDDYSAVFADPDRPGLFARPIEEIRPVLTVLP